MPCRLNWFKSHLSNRYIEYSNLKFSTDIDCSYKIKTYIRKLFQALIGKYLFTFDWELPITLHFHSTLLIFPSTASWDLRLKVISVFNFLRYQSLGKRTGITEKRSCKKPSIDQQKNTQKKIFAKHCRKQQFYRMNVKSSNDMTNINSKVFEIPVGGLI